MENCKNEENKSLGSSEGSIHEKCEKIDPNYQPCYFERNDYGFMQKRVYSENLLIPAESLARGNGKIEMNEILNPTNTVKYGR